MTPNDGCDQTVPGPVHLLAEQVFDFSENQPLSPTLGKTDAPVCILPELVLQWRPARSVPALQLSLSLQPGIAPGEAALDLFRQWRAIGRSRGDGFGRSQPPLFQRSFHRRRKHPGNASGQSMRDSGGTLDTSGRGVRQIQVDPACGEDLKHLFLCEPARFPSRSPGPNVNACLMQRLDPLASIAVRLADESDIVLKRKMEALVAELIARPLAADHVAIPDR